MICLIHPRQRDGGLGPGLTLARRGAALGLGARRGAACRPLCGSDARAKGSCDLRKARLACAEVVRGCRAADIRHGGAAAARRRRARSRLQGAPRVKLASAKAKEDRASAHRGLGLKGGPAQRGRRREPAAELDTVLAGRLMWGLSGSLDGTARRLVALRSEPGGQRGPSKAGGKNS